MNKAQPDGYLALPPGGEGPGVLVLHAWWGLNDTIKNVCERLAGAGFSVFAPDLYHGKIAKTIAEAETLGGAVDANHQQAEDEVAAAARFLHERVGQGERGLAVVAFSLGGYFALHLADTNPELVDAVVLFYGTDGAVGGDYKNSRASYLGHFAENDPYETQSNVDTLEETLKRAGRPVTFHRYEGVGHWFFEPDRQDAYNKAAARLAWERTLDFLKRSSAENQPESTLVELIRYNNWANAQLLEACQKLTADQLDSTQPGTYGSIRDTIRHIIGAEADYVGRVTGNPPQPSFKWEDQPALGEISIFSNQVAAALLDTVQRVSPTFLVHEEEDGNYIDYHARHLYIQTINHGIEHRTNITTILASLGITTPEVDGWGYLFSHPERFELKEGSR